MFWLARPPYFRRLLAVMVLAGAVWFELAPSSLVLHPYARRPLTAGSRLVETDFDMRPVAAGVLPPVKIAGVLSAGIAAGEPLTPGLIGTTPLVPTGWWALEVPVPVGTMVGGEVRLVVDSGSGARMVPGMVVAVTEAGDFDGPEALVAVPETQAAATATALSQGTLQVLLGSVLPGDDG